VTEEIDWTDPRQVASIHRQSATGSGEPNKATEARNVFAVDRSQCLKACDQGLGVGASYLVLGCHTKGNTATTTASANAIEKLVGIHHRSASKYISAMQSVGLIERTDGRSNPRSSPMYRLLMPPNPELVWLPVCIVRGNEMPPLKLLWHMQDVRALRCFVELYFWSHLPTDGGISRGVLRRPFDRQEIGRAGDVIVWGFRQPPVGPTGDRAVAEFFEPFCELGLLKEAPHLFLSDDPDASVIHPYGVQRTRSAEDMIGVAAHEAGLALISNEQRRFAQEEGLWLAPVPRNMPRVSMVGIARLRFQPETQTTVDWLRHLAETAPRIIAEYERLAASAGTPSSPVRLGLLC
jgi:hypothetical protein